MNEQFTRRLFHLLCAREAQPPTYSDEEYGESFGPGVESTRRFFDRLGSNLEVERRSVLDIGCGGGVTCLEAVRRGAERAVGVDIQSLDWARQNIRTRCPDLADRVDLISTDGSLRELGEQRFDVVLSKDSFEHYADPEAFVSVMEGFARPGGMVAIGFGPLWNGPTGGHIGFMTKLPWAHLLFSERTIMAERRRFRPAESATRFEEIRGGLNKMTLERFERIMRRPGLRTRFFAVNLSENPVVRAMDVVSRLPGMREYFTANVYGVWVRRLCAAEATRGSYM